MNTDSDGSGGPGMTRIAGVKRSKERARASYDRMSRFYDFLTVGSERRTAQVGLEMLAVSAGERALEIGFGTGRALVEIARAVGLDGKACGIDISGGMLEVARARLNRNGLVDRAMLLRGDAAALPYEDDLFDAVFASFTLELFDTPEIPVVLAECARVLHPGGRLCIVAMSDRDSVRASVKLYLWAHEKFTTYVDCRPIPLRALVESAGFDVLESRDMSMWRLPVDAVLARWEA